MRAVMTRLYQRNDDFVHRCIAGEHLLIALHRREATPLYAINATSAAVWEQLGSWRSAEALADAVASRFAVSREEALDDISSLLDQLESIGALHARQDAP